MGFVIGAIAGPAFIYLGAMLFIELGVVGVAIWLLLAWGLTALYRRVMTALEP